MTRATENPHTINGEPLARVLPLAVVGLDVDATSKSSLRLQS